MGTFPEYDRTDRTDRTDSASGFYDDFARAFNDIGAFIYSNLEDLNEYCNIDYSESKFVNKGHSDVLYGISLYFIRAKLRAIKDYTILVIQYYLNKVILRSKTSKSTKPPKRNSEWRGRR